MTAYHTAVDAQTPDAEKTVTFAGLAADTRGVRDGRPPLVLLHGLTFDRRLWRPALQELELLDPGRYAVAFDLPGHGQSLELESYRLPNVVARIFAAIEEAELRAPILVGHSISAVIATVYAGTHPTSGVVDVGQSLYLPPFASFIRTRADEIQGAGFDEVWRHLWASMNAHLLSRDAERLLVETSRPRQEVALGYWRDLLDRPLGEIDVWAAGRLGALRAAGVAYEVIVGNELDPLYRDWLAWQLPQAKVTVLPGSGHFPHLAHPRAFAQSLAEFAGAGGSTVC